MSDRAVVALEEVLGAHLPVRRVLVDLPAPVEGEPSELDPVLGEAFGDVAEPLLERACFGVEVGEDERPPFGDRDLRGGQGRLIVESWLALRARSVRSEPSRSYVQAW